MGRYDIEVVRSVINTLRYVPENDRKMLQKHIEALATEPRPPGHEPVVANFCRIRAEDYRIVYEVSDEEQLITVTHIGQRSSYRRRS